MLRSLPPLILAAATVGLPLATGAQTVSAPAEAPPAQDATAPQQWAIHGQATNVWLFQPAFRSPYQGPQSLSPAANGRETLDATVYAGVRPWQGAEIWINPEIDQGFGLSNTFGVAGYVSGEAYKLGEADPYYRMARAFFRQTIDLGGESQKVDPDLNQLGGTQTANRVVLTVGKFAAVDIFDNNKYAHDPRNDFLNWSIVDVGTFDYAADAWGTTYGATAEWYQDWWTIRLGAFDLSNVPNSTHLALPLFQQTQFVAELEERHTLWDQPGKLRFLVLAHARQSGHLCGRTRAGCGDRHNAINGCGPQLSKQIWHRAEPGTATCQRPWHVPASRLDARQRRRGRFHRYRPIDIDGTVVNRLPLGAAG